jgi:ribosome-associated translation inhibitor RaiA
VQVQINTDHNIEGREALAAHVRAVVENALRRSSDQVTRVEVHLSDEVGGTSGQNDKRCVMEARLANREPIAVTHHAATLHQTVDGAARKLTRLAESTIERLHDKKSRATAPSHAVPKPPEER